MGGNTFAAGGAPDEPFLYRLGEGMGVVDAPDGTGEPAIEELFYPTERVPFVEWHRISGAKPAVALTGVLTLLAFVTGLSNLSQSVLVADGPLTAVVAMPPWFVRFGGVLFAFLLGLVTVGLQRRKRIAWRVAAVAVLLVGGAETLQALAVLTGGPFAVLSLVAMGGLTKTWLRHERGHPSLLGRLSDRIPTVPTLHGLDPRDGE